MSKDEKGLTKVSRLAVSMIYNEAATAVTIKIVNMENDELTITQVYKGILGIINRIEEDIKADTEFNKKGPSDASN